MFSQSLNSAALHRPHGYDEIPAVIRTELNVHRDRDVIVRMQDLARKKRMRHPDITDHEMADYLALAENFQNFEQWISTRRSSSQATGRARIRSAMAIAVAIGLLAATVILGIAITV
jgi:hypothetical protein